MAQIEPTEDEKKNGWTAETLTAYVRERDNVDHRKPKERPVKTNSKYSPFRWRG